MGFVLSSARRNRWPAKIMKFGPSLPLCPRNAPRPNNSPSRAGLPTARFPWHRRVVRRIVFADYFQVHYVGGAVTPPLRLVPALMRLLWSRRLARGWLEQFSSQRIFQKSRSYVMAHLV